MRIEFDKRIELLYGLIYCVDRDMNRSLHPELFVEVLPSYCNDFYEMYKKSASDELIDYIKAYGMNKSTTMPAFIALSLDDDYNIIESRELERAISLAKNDIYDKEKIERLLKEFVLKAKYEEFYNNHKSLYEKIIHSFKESMNGCEAFDENYFIKFYGYKIKDIIIKLYNFSCGSMGIIVGNYQYYVQKVDNIGESEEKFQFKPKHINIIHEMSHPYISPYIDKYFENISFSNLLAEAKNHGLPKCYDNPSDTRTWMIFNEYMVRAIAIYLGSKNEEQKRKLIEEEKSEGFLYMSEIVELFNRKAQYETFEEFFKEEIVKYCLTLSDNYKK